MVVAEKSSPWIRKRGARGSSRRYNSLRKYFSGTQWVIIKCETTQHKKAMRSVEMASWKRLLAKAFQFQWHQTQFLFVLISGPMRYRLISHGTRRRKFAQKKNDAAGESSFDTAHICSFFLYCFAENTKLRPWSATHSYHIVVTNIRSRSERQQKNCHDFLVHVRSMDFFFFALCCGSAAQQLRRENGENEKLTVGKWERLFVR